MESDLWNNTNRSHDFVDLLVELEAERGIKIDGIDTARLREAGFTVEGATVNGVKTKNGEVLINLQSSKSLNSVLGHEITHVLEGTEAYKVLKDAVVKYAKSKGEYDKRLTDITKLYKKAEGADVDAELTADLVGDYLFTDEGFIKSLTEHKNLFQRIFDEIKYFCSIAVKGSNEETKLLKIKRAFEKALTSMNEEKVQVGGENVDYQAEEAYSYEFLTKQKDMAVSTLPEIADVVNKEGKIVRSDIIELAIDNAQKYGKKVGDAILVKNNYTNREYRITKESIRHSLGGDRNRLLTNARISSIAGEIIKNGIPLNALHNTSQSADGTYAIATLTKDSNSNVYVSIATIEERNNEVISIQKYDVVHSISARQKNNGDAQSGKKPQGKNPPMNISDVISISDFLKIVNTTYQSILSDDVLRKLGESKSPNGYYTNRVKFSLEKSSDKFKQKQFEIIQDTNPMWDDYHVGLRSAEDIRTWEEVLELNDESEGQFVWGDFSREDALQALEKNSITVYSSHPIVNGTFVSTSYIQAREYAGGSSNSKVYSKTVPLIDVAWINGDEGQYAALDKDMSLNIEESNKSVDNYAEIRYNSNIRFLHKNFPPENEVLSEAHRLATWWARREDVSAGDRTLISMKNRWYVVEMFDDAENYYQVEGWIRKADYNKVLEDIKKYGRSDRIKSIQRSTNRIDMFDQSSGSLEGRESSSNRVRVEYREKNKQIQPMDQETPYWRERSASDGNGDSSSSGADKQGSNIKSSISSEISPKKASLTDGVFFDGKDGDSYSLSDAGDGDLAPMGRYDVRGDDVAYVGDDLAPLKPEYSSGGAQYSLSGGPVLDDDLPLSEKYKEERERSSLAPLKSTTFPTTILTREKNPAIL